MKKRITLFCSTFCFLSATLPGSVMATPVEELLDPVEEQAEQCTEGENREGGHHLVFVTADFRLETVSMEAGAPIGTLILYVSDKDGKIIKDAQVITTIIDGQGNQQSDRALPYKCGYLVGVDQLPIGEYLVETEIVTGGQLLTEEFRFNKA